VLISCGWIPISDNLHTGRQKDSGSDAGSQSHEVTIEEMIGDASAPYQAHSPRMFSAHSTSSVPDSAWFVSDLMLGAGMVVLQPASEKMAVVYDNRLDFWFLPKGRKDVGESLEQTALREAYEEVRPSDYPSATGTRLERARQPVSSQV
jgi:hypothetical protein